MMKTIYVSVTIDVENPQTPLFEKRFADNRIWSEGHGIERIIEILDKCGIRGTFFTNVYEYVVWGKKEMERIVKFIHDKGHDVELHTHPIWIDEKRRENMFQFSLHEQRAIIEFGADFIEKCTGRRPVCHRAGAYGFNFDTLISCEKAGISIDSSNFFGHPNCRIIVTGNEPIYVGHVLELPVTFYHNDRQIVKTDLDWADEQDFKTFVMAVRNDVNFNFINFFFHSYSLSKTNDGFRMFAPDPEKVAKLERMLDWLKTESDCKVISMADLAGAYEDCAKSQVSEVSPDEKSRRSPVILTKAKIDFDTINLEKSQWYSLEKLREFQNHHLRKLIRHCYEHVPFYRDYMKNNKIHLEDIRTVDDLKLLPVIDKDIIKEEPTRFKADNAELFSPQWSHTSGSTGKPLRFILDAKNLLLEAAFVNRAWAWAGLDINTKLCVIRAFQLPSLCIEGMLYGQQATFFSGYDVSEKTIPTYVAQLRRHGSILLYGFPSNLYEFARMFRAIGFDPLPVKSIVTSSETLYPFQREFIEGTFGAKIYDIYGQGEHVSFINQCSKGVYHDNMEYGLTEYIPVKNTALGTHEIVATGLHNFSMPFVRYRLGDTLFMNERRCPCGRAFPGIKAITGKEGDMIVKADGSCFSGISVTNAFGDYNNIKEYQVVQKDIGDFEITMVVTGDVKQLKSLVREKIVEMVGDDIRCTFHIVDRIPRTKAGKHRIVKSLVKPEQVHLAGVSIAAKAEETVSSQAREKPIQQQVVFSVEDRYDSSTPTIVRKSKPKICHIGASHARQSVDIIEELDKLGYKQCVIGYYPVEKSIVPKHIPVYYFPFRSYADPDWNRLNMENNLYKFVAGVLAKEKPQIIQGHSLTYSCVALWMTKRYFNLPTVVFPWSTLTIKVPDPNVNRRERECLETVDILLHPLPSVARMIEDFYDIQLNGRYVPVSGAGGVDFKDYSQPRKVTKTPMILSARVMGSIYRQDLLVQALPELVKEFPDLMVTFLIGQIEQQGREYFNKMVKMAEHLGILKHCVFVSRSLNQEEFAESIKSHNIIYSLASHDTGLSYTALVAAFSGAVTIVQDTPEIDGMLEHDVNVLRTRLDLGSVTETLRYAIKNIVPLQEKFIENNMKLDRFDKSKQLNILGQVYERLANKR